MVKLLIIPSIFRLGGKKMSNEENRMYWSLTVAMAVILLSMSMVAPTLSEHVNARETSPNGIGPAPIPNSGGGDNPEKLDSDHKVINLSPPDGDIADAAIYVSLWENNDDKFEDYDYRIEIKISGVELECDDDVEWVKGGALIGDEFPLPDEANDWTEKKEIGDSPESAEAITYANAGELHAWGRLKSNDYYIQNHQTFEIDLQQESIEQIHTVMP